MELSLFKFAQIWVMVIWSSFPLRFLIQLIISKSLEAVSEIHYFSRWSPATLPNNILSSEVDNPLSENQISVKSQLMRPETDGH